MDHAVLLGMLPVYAVGSQPINWFRSYLLGQRQKALIGGVKPDLCSVRWIPTGLYPGISLISDLPSCTLFSKPMQDVYR